MTDGMISLNIDPRVSAGAALWRPQAKVVAIAAGAQHSLLLTEAGTVLTSGSNERGQADVPPGLFDVVAIAAGYAHSLALRRDGTVVAWGNNTRGASTVPPDLGDVVAISAGGGHSAAVLANGSVIVWGQLGFGAMQPPRALTDARYIASGSESCFAILGDGTVVAWGQTQLGAPELPVDLIGVVGIDGFDDSSPRWVAVKGDGKVVVGGSPDTSSAALTGVVQIAAGLFHCLARLRDGTVVGWGESAVLHTPPDGMRDVTAVSAGSEHSLALRSDGTVIAWGRNGYQQLQGPADSTVEFVGWEEDGYFLPSLTAREPSSTTEKSSDQLRRQLEAAIDRAVEVRAGNAAAIGRVSIEGVQAVSDYFGSASDADRELWRSLFQKLWTKGYWVGKPKNLIASKMVEVAGRLGWTGEIAFASELMSAPSAPPSFGWPRSHS